MMLTFCPRARKVAKSTDRKNAHISKALKVSLYAGSARAGKCADVSCPACAFQLCATAADMACRAARARAARPAGRPRAHRRWRQQLDDDWRHSDGVVGWQLNGMAGSAALREHVNSRHVIAGGGRNGRDHSNEEVLRSPEWRNVPCVCEPIPEITVEMGGPGSLRATASA